MSAFNAIGGIIFGTIVLSVIWFIIIGLIKESNNDKSDFSMTIIVILAFIVMIITCLAKCSS